MALGRFYIRDIVRKGRVGIHCVPTEGDIADLGTKFLNKPCHRYLIGLTEGFRPCSVSSARKGLSAYRTEIIWGSNISYTSNIMSILYANASMCYHLLRV